MIHAAATMMMLKQKACLEEGFGGFCKRIFDLGGTLFYCLTRDHYIQNKIMPKTFWGLVYF